MSPSAQAALNRKVSSDVLSRAMGYQLDTDRPLHLASREELLVQLMTHMDLIEGIQADILSMHDRMEAAGYRV